MTRSRLSDDTQTLASLRWNISADRVIIAGLRFRVALERRANFDPAQPRDDLGRWTDGGGSTSARIGDPGETKPAQDGRVRVAGPFDWGLVDLRYEEGNENAHAILYHVGKTEG